MSVSLHSKFFTVPLLFDAFVFLFISLSSNQSPVGVSRFPKSGLVRSICYCKAALALHCYPMNTYEMEMIQSSDWGEIVGLNWKKTTFTH